MKIKLIICLVVVSLTKTGIAQTKIIENILSAGPMLGYVDFREAKVWILPAKRGFYSVTYYDSVNPSLKFNTFSQVVHETWQPLTFTLNKVEPGRVYFYQVIAEKATPTKKFYRFKSPDIWRHRKDAPDFKIALGSCNYRNETAYDRPGVPYGDTQTDIFNVIASKTPNLMLWLGDNTYLRESDWNSASGIYKRNAHTRSDPKLQKLLQTCSNLAIWDDHDFGPNDATGSFYYKNHSLQAFQEYWANPGYGINTNPGTTSAFEYNDASFFMLDGRYNRRQNSCDTCTDGTLLGDEQIQWLKESLQAAPRDNFKLVAVGSQFLNNAPLKDNFSNYMEERNEIIRFIQQNKIKNVIFLTGDRHFSEISTLKKDNLPTIYDFTCSPLTSGLYSKKGSEKNDFSVAGSTYSETHNFGMIEFTGTAKNRVFSFVLFDEAGKQIYKFDFTKE